MTSATRRGLLFSAGIFIGWLGSWALLLPTNLSQLPTALVLVAVVLRTLLQTGLFIVAHDAMHGTLWPGRPAVNHGLGTMALFLYAALPYRRCRANHQLHHRHAGTLADPDHHGIEGDGVWGWYRRFMAAYLSPQQVAVLGLVWLALATGAAATSASPLTNVVLYGILPTLLSSLQLFVVGTYLPHRTGLASRVGGSGVAIHTEEMHRPRSLDLPTWLSLLSCYHFGYHWEHHAFPHLAWHELPQARLQVRLG